MGDSILKSFYTICKTSTREIDILGRYFGIQLIIFLPGTDYKGAEILARRIHQSIYYKKFNFEEEFIQVTVTTGGISLVPRNEDSLESIIAQAETAFSQAQKSEGNKILILSHREKSEIKKRT
jgi:diguanylate cyclase (GGDEF)-like protein